MKPMSIFKPFAASSDTGRSKLTTLGNMVIQVPLDADFPTYDGVRWQLIVGPDYNNGNDTSGAIASGSATITWKLTDTPDVPPLSHTFNSGPGYIQQASSTLGPYTELTNRFPIVVSAAGVVGSGVGAVLQGVDTNQGVIANRWLTLTLNVTGVFSGLSVPWAFGLTFDPIRQF
jgi:hypothetical protein